MFEESTVEALWSVAAFSRLNVERSAPAGLGAELPVASAAAATAAERARLEGHLGRRPKQRVPVNGMRLAPLGIGGSPSQHSGGARGQTPATVICFSGGSGQNGGRGPGSPFVRIVPPSAVLGSGPFDPMHPRESETLGKLSWTLDPREPAKDLSIPPPPL